MQAQALDSRVQIDNVRFEVIDLRPDDVVDALVTNNASVWLQAGKQNLSLAPGTQLTLSLDMRIDAFMDPSGMDLELVKRLGAAKLRDAGPGHGAGFPDADRLDHHQGPEHHPPDPDHSGTRHPAPGTWATFGLGLAGVAFAARRRQVPLKRGSA